MDQILKQARNHLVCPVCNGQYKLGEIRLRGFIDNTYIFQAFCERGHEPMFVTYLASLHRLEKPISSHFHVLSGNKITQKEADEAKDLFSSFDGDFQKAFKKDKSIK